MTLKRIRDIPRPCLHQEHHPPNMMVLQPGVYEHTCPGCGQATTFTVPYIVARSEGPTIAYGTSGSPSGTIRCATL